LPDANGADLIEWVRSHVGWTLPILVLTASREEHVVLAALAAGADDFVLKQPQPLELLARISALARRTANLNVLSGSAGEVRPKPASGPGHVSGATPWPGSGSGSTRESGSELRVGPFVIDPLRQLLTLDGVPVTLTQKEFDLALYLFQSDGLLLSRDHLLNKIWGFHAEVDTRTVDTHISRLRKKLRLDGRLSWKLISVYGVGYRLDDGSSSAALNMPLTI
jgi:DNA-binding response OmpR family regulator